VRKRLLTRTSPAAYGGSAHPEACAGTTEHCKVISSSLTTEVVASIQFEPPVELS